METREELLEGLRYTKNMITKIINAQQEQVRIVAQYREEETGISTTGFKDRTKLVVMVAGIAVLLFHLVIGLTTGQFFSFVWFLITGIMALRAWKRHKKGVKLWISLAVVGGVVPVVDYMGNIGFWVMFIPVLLVVVFAVRYVVRMKNEQVARNNEAIGRENKILQQQYDDITNRLKSLRDELSRRTSAWYPKSYYALNAVSFFIDAVENYRADSVKEMVNLFETTKEHQETINAQTKINASLQQQLLNQEQIRKELRCANVLNVMNLAMQAGTQDAIDRNTVAVNNSADRMVNMGRQIVDSTNRAASSMGRAADAVDEIRKKLRG